MTSGETLSLGIHITKPACSIKWAMSKYFPVYHKEMIKKKLKENHEELSSTESEMYMTKTGGKPFSWDPI